MHESIVLFGAGSPVIVEVEETCSRLGINIAAIVRNVAGESPALGADRVIDAVRITAAHKTLEATIPLFGPARRQQALGEARRLGFTSFARLVDPTAIVASSARLGSGTYINAGVVIGGATSIGCFVFVNRGVLIGHHVQIDDFASVGPGAILAGQVRVGRGVMIGAGATIAPKISIGANSAIALGSAVTRDVPAHCLVVGNPGRIVKRDYVGYGGAAVDSSRD